ncbi:Uncharacterised protein [Mycobacteroides abscessus subsp. abscessus]|nr:Uncharacterised protein [Mycobacteroides abscessus subsp. abscessus]SKT97328.1 Uncharacterised protein [Mycobacteroides abscessus subsp. abscessus]
MLFHTWTATSSVSRIAASSNAHAAAPSLDSESSMPTTTGPPPGTGDSLTTTTGLCPFAVSDTETEPAIIPVNPPRPLEPSTVIRAFLDSSTRTGTGLPVALTVETSTFGCSA